MPGILKKLLKPVVGEAGTVLTNTEKASFGKLLGEHLKDIDPEDPAAAAVKGVGVVKLDKSGWGKKAAAPGILKNIGRTLSGEAAEAARLKHSGSQVAHMGLKDAVTKLKDANKDSVRGGVSMFGNRTLEAAEKAEQEMGKAVDADRRAHIGEQVKKWGGRGVLAAGVLAPPAAVVAHHVAKKDNEPRHIVQKEAQSLGMKLASMFTPKEAQVSLSGPKDAPVAHVGAFLNSTDPGHHQRFTELLHEHKNVQKAREAFHDEYPAVQSDIHVHRSATHSGTPAITVSGGRNVDRAAFAAHVAGRGEASSGRNGTATTETNTIGQGMETSASDAAWRPPRKEQNVAVGQASEVLVKPKPGVLAPASTRVSNTTFTAMRPSTPVQVEATGTRPRTIGDAPELARSSQKAPGQQPGAETRAAAARNNARVDARDAKDVPAGRPVERVEPTSHFERLQPAGTPVQRTVAPATAAPTAPGRIPITDRLRAAQPTTSFEKLQPAGVPVQRAPATAAPAPQSAMAAIQPDAIIPAGAPRPAPGVSHFQQPQASHAPTGAPPVTSHPVPGTALPVHVPHGAGPAAGAVAGAAHAGEAAGGSAARSMLHGVTPGRALAGAGVVAGAGLLAHHMFKKKPQQAEQGRTATASADEQNHAKWELGGLGMLAGPEALHLAAKMPNRVGLALKPVSEGLEHSGLGHAIELGGLGILAKPSIDTLRTKHAGASSATYVDSTEHAAFRQRCDKVKAPCGLGRDAQGYFAHTQRARSRSYRSIGAIPDAVLRQISSTG